MWFSADPSSPPTTAWQCGAEMLQQGEIAAGLAAWQNVVAHKPHDLAPRQTLRETERKLHAEHVSDDESAAAALTEIWWAIHQAKHKRADKFIDWDAVDREAEQGLAIDPTDVELHLELAHACRARGYRDVAQFAYHCALELAPGRADIKQQLAELSE